MQSLDLNPGNLDGSLSCMLHCSTYSTITCDLYTLPLAYRADCESCRDSEAIGYLLLLVGGGWCRLQTSGTCCSLVWSKTSWASQVALVVKNLPANSGDVRDEGSIPRSGRSPGGEHGNPLQYSYLENLHRQRSQQATVHTVAKNRTRLKQLSMHAHAMAN